MLPVGYAPKRFFSYIFTDNGILSSPIAISSNYIILFVVFAAFLQATHAGAYFANVAFAMAGDKRGGPAKVAVFASGIIVGVIALTGIGTRFSALLLGIADQSQLLAMVFSMLVPVVLGMGMPTTAAYAVAASVIAPA